MSAVAAGIAAGYAADRLLGDPARYHPVAGFGRAALTLERAWFRQSRLAGALYAATLVGAVAAATTAVDRLTRRRPVARAAVTAAAIWASLGGRSLHREARAVTGLAAAGDLDGARRRVPALVSRDPHRLDPEGLYRATVESVAENTSDAVVAPLLLCALAGPAGAAAHRAANTLDAMVGYRTARYERFGWAAARLDDLMNLVPARLTALLAAAAAGGVGGSSRRSLAAARRDGRRHPSPNAGLTEAAFAGALGVRLGGDVIAYQGRPVRRPAVGDGSPPTPADVERAIRLSRAVGAAAAVLAVVLALARQAGR